MSRKFNAQIIYTMKPSHPDYNNLDTGSWFRDRYLTYEDTYTFNNMYNLIPTQSLIENIKRDLCLVASGGYSDEYIDNVSYVIREVK